MKVAEFTAAREEQPADPFGWTPEERKTLMTPERTSAAPAKPAPGLVVVAAGWKKTDRGASSRSFDDEVLSGLSGKPVPFATSSEAAVTAAAEALAADAPHLAPAVRQLASGVVECLRREGRLGLPPTLLVGPPGTGKTWALLEFARLIGWPHEPVPCSAVRDASFGGTSRGWATAHMSLPMEAVVRHKVCNPLILLDELEKVPESRHHGNLHEVALPMLERHTALRWSDPLAGPVDLSCVAWCATANSLLPIPIPLLDRFAVAHVPELTREQTEIVARSIARREWGADLEPTEWEAIRRAMPRRFTARALSRLVGAVFRSRPSPENSPRVADIA